MSVSTSLSHSWIYLNIIFRTGFHNLRLMNFFVIVCINPYTQYQLPSKQDQEHMYRLNNNFSSYALAFQLVVR